MIQITATLKLDHCWVCHCKESDGNKLHSHHVVPRNSGGSGGPTVTLCSSHHNGIHDAALSCYSKSGGSEKYRKMNTWLEMLPEVAQAHERFYYLVDVIIRARHATTEDKNKRATVVTSLSGADNKLLNNLCDQLSAGGQRMTKSECMLYAMRMLAARLGIK